MKVTSPRFNLQTVVFHSLLLLLFQITSEIDQLKESLNTTRIELNLTETSLRDNLRSLTSSLGARVLFCLLILSSHSPTYFALTKG